MILELKQVKCCLKCGLVLPVSEFYRHKQMADGYLNRCKKCVKRRVSDHRRSNDHVREYDRNRSKTKKRKALGIANTKRWRKKNDAKYRAQNAVNNAIRDGKLKKEPCLFCGEPKAHGHHNDYAKPLDVVWLCAKCHHRLHAYFGVK